MTMILWPPPEDVAAQVLTRITATLQGLPQGAKGIRVHASLNSKEALISPHDSASTAAGTAMGGGSSRHLARHWRPRLQPARLASPSMPTQDARSGAAGAVAQGGAAGQRKKD